MIIENDIFKNTEIDKNLLQKYGFTLSNGLWCYEISFMNEEFKAVIKIDKNGYVTGNVYEAATQDIFLPLRVDGMNGYAAEVRNAYINILKDIKEKCCHENVFISPQANRLAQAIYEKYKDKPIFPWDNFSGGVFKNQDNGKWYAIVMNINIKKIDKKMTGEFDIMNIKLDSEKIKELHKQNGFYPAYHMNKKNWISILLNETISDITLLQLIDESHAFTTRKSRAKSNYCN